LAGKGQPKPVNTVDFQKPSKSLHSMLGPGGKPSTAKFFSVVLQALQKQVGLSLAVKAA